jgi:hypothetical protein
MEVFLRGNEIQKLKLSVEGTNEFKGIDFGLRRFCGCARVEAAHNLWGSPERFSSFMDGC